MRIHERAPQFTPGLPCGDPPNWPLTAPVPPAGNNSGSLQSAPPAFLPRSTPMLLPDHHIAHRRVTYHPTLIRPDLKPDDIPESVPLAFLPCTASEGARNPRGRTLAGSSYQRPSSCSHCSQIQDPPALPQPVRIPSCPILRRLSPLTASFQQQRRYAPRQVVPACGFCSTTAPACSPSRISCSLEPPPGSIYFV